jgi:hypothetical protein
MREKGVARSDIWSASPLLVNKKMFFILNHDSLHVKRIFSIETRVVHLKDRIIFDSSFESYQSAQAILQI